MEDFSFDNFEEFNTNTQNDQNDIFVDFRGTEVDNKFVKKDYVKKYDDETTNKYKSMRKFRVDPIKREVIDKKIPTFKVKKMWDSLTGLFEDKDDPHGPLHFDPVELAKYFYLHILDHIWREEDEDNYEDVLEEGPLEGLGTGENFLIKGRGEYPEYFVWRLPIKDCYVIEGTEKFIPLKGPKLSLSQIEKLQKLIEKCPKSHVHKTFINMPNMVHMYKLYMEAINPDPDISVLDNPDDPDAKYKANMLAARRLAEL